MLELLVAADMGNLIPAVLFQALYGFSAGHKTRYTLFTHLSSGSLKERRQIRAAHKISGCLSIFFTSIAPKADTAIWRQKNGNKIGKKTGINYQIY